ncbi:hypothetical protein BJ969_001134 [Saccharopolyspora gloriosae]|uniref:DUF3048 family protein n=1 Tax=Saccharopolyspora gloriosae TaxID=455344 RepID=A0A840N7G8_9PSEU|nr:DUF3048 domain-containing protein [Saccharopolyspora gloriosae]MBB5068046.1 hypothetical protein [Saccharopolyspora gloriosae]
MVRFRGVLVRAAVLLAVLATVLAGGLACQPARTQRAPDEPQGAAPPPEPTAEAPAAGAPSSAPPVLAVKIDNVPEARPPTGIGSADVVVVEPVEGGLSRLVAVFGAKRPPVVGPVRSARETDLELLSQFGRPTLVFSGAAPELLPKLDSAAVDPVRPEQLPGAFFRGGDRPVPHNLFVRPGEVPAGAAWSPKAPLVFGPAPAGGVPRESAQVDYLAASTGFTWSPEQQRWLVSMDGEPAAATDSGRLGAGTVVLQEVRVRDSALSDSAGSVSPHAETVGSGRAVVLRDGKAFEARWSRPGPDVGTSYTTPSGAPLPFAPGPVWVALNDRL